MAERLIEFVGRECSYSRTMEPLVEKLEKETGLKIIRIESPVATIFRQELIEACSRIGVKACFEVDQYATPVFYNEETEEVLCGAQDYKILKEWALKR